MIEWSDAAIEAAWNALFQEPYDGTGAPMINAALDAALAAQGCPKLPDCKTYADRAYAEGWADALEEAAKTIPTVPWTGNVSRLQRNISHAIRALKEKNG